MDSRLAFAAKERASSESASSEQSHFLAKRVSVAEGEVNKHRYSVGSTTAVPLCAKEEGSFETASPGDAPTLTADQSPYLRALWCLLPFSVGVCVPWIGATNAALGDFLRSTWWSVTYAYGSCALLVCLFALFTARRDPSMWGGLKSLKTFVFADKFNFLCLCGGLFGLLINLSSAVGTSVLGSSIAALGMLFGQLAQSFVFDLTGMLWTTKRGFWWPCLVGILVVLTGGILYQLNSLISSDSDPESDSGSSVGAQIGTMVLCIVGGGLICCQSGANAKLGTVVGRLRRACGLAYFTGTLVALVLAPAVQALSSSSTSELEDYSFNANWWKFLSTPFNIWTMIAAPISCRHLSYSTAFALIVAGQLACSMLTDACGLFGVTQTPINLFNVLGFLVVMLGVLLITFVQKPTTAEMRLKMSQDIEAQSENDLPLKAHSTLVA